MTTKNKTPETKLVSYTTFNNADFKPPSRFFIRLATGDYLFIKCQRKAAENYVQEEFGGKYKLRVL